MIETTVVDKTVLAELLESVGGDVSFVVELIDTYTADAPNLLAQLRTALAAGDVETFRRAAHTLKSSSTSLGALTLSAIAREMEMTAKAGSLDGTEEKLAGAEAEYARVCVALDRFKAENGG